MLPSPSTQGKVLNPPLDTSVMRARLLVYNKLLKNKKGLSEEKRNTLPGSRVHVVSGVVCVSGVGQERSTTPTEATTTTKRAGDEPRVHGGMSGERHAIARATAVSTVRGATVHW